MPPEGHAPQRSKARFAIAVSFPGEARRRAEAIALWLADRVGCGRVLYDKFH